MGLVTGFVAQGESRVHTARVHCDGDGCARAASGVESATPERAARLAKWRAEEQGFAPHAKGRKWKCPRCRLLTLPDHLRRLFPRLHAELGLDLPPDEGQGNGAEGGKGRRGRRKK
jgi:hypothetical protein